MLKKQTNSNPVARYENTGVRVSPIWCEKPGSNRFEVSGTKGKLLCEDNKLIYCKLSKDSQEFSNTYNPDDPFAKLGCERIEVETDGKNPQHSGIINNFLNYLLGEEELFVKGADGIGCVELMNAIELSSWQGGKEVSLPVDKTYI